MKLLLHVLLAAAWLHACASASDSTRIGAAEQFMKGGRYFAACKEYETLVHELQSANGDSGEALLRASEGHVEALLADEQFARAVKSALSTVELAGRMLEGDQKALAESWTRLAVLLGRARRIDLAGKLLDQVVAISEGTKNKSTSMDEVTASAELQIGIFFTNLERFDEAMTHFRKSLTLAERATGNESMLVQRICQQLARAVEGYCLKTGSSARMQEGEELCQRALQCAIKLAAGRSGERVALALAELAISCQRNGSSDKAIDLATEALEIGIAAQSERPDALGTLMDVYTQLMKALGKQVQASEKISHWVSATKETAEASSGKIGNLLHAAGKGYATLGYAAEAENAYWEAMKAREAELGKDHPETARSLMNVAILVQARGDLANPESMIKRCIEIDENQPGGWSNEAMLTRIRLFGLHIKQGRINDALAVQETMLRMERERYGHARQTGVASLVMLAEHHLAKNDLKPALKAWQEALSTAMESPEDHHALGLIVTVPILQAAHRQNAVLEMEPTLRRCLVKLAPLASDDRAIAGSIMEWKRLYSEALAAIDIDVAVVADRLAKMISGTDPGDLRP
ncbi:MAG: tetratricopeptide repeat protein [Verrucomicrobiaceae bacterium]|nr:tetratricopeptide repeat protein [Verrucomicrobiaceae bacterium]